LKIRVPIPRAIQKLRANNVSLEGRAGKMRLDFNENTVGCSPAVLRAVRKLSAEQLAMYPEYRECTGRLARRFGARSDELTLTNGADGGLQQIASTFVDRGSSILLMKPTFVMYPFFAAMAGARIKYVPYDSGMCFPFDDVMKALRGSPRVFFLANPNNPTGTLVSRGVIKRMIQSAPRTLIVVDEAYYEFSGVTVLPWIRRYSNLIVVRTFSKAAGLAGLRLGCLFACRELTDILNRTREPFAVNVAALVAAEATVRNHKQVKAYAKEIQASSRMLAAYLTRIGIRVFPSAGNFLLAYIGPRTGTLLKKLADEGILLRDRKADFGREGFVRITLGPRPMMRRLIRALEQAL
jgi:histidinol-phosphate aminotransferase